MEKINNTIENAKRLLKIYGAEFFRTASNAATETVKIIINFFGTAENLLDFTIKENIGEKLYKKINAEIEKIKKDKTLEEAIVYITENCQKIIIDLLIECIPTVNEQMQKYIKKLRKQIKNLPEEIKTKVSAINDELVDLESVQITTYEEYKKIHDELDKIEKEIISIYKEYLMKKFNFIKVSLKNGISISSKHKKKIETINEENILFHTQFIEDLYNNLQRSIQNTTVPTLKNVEVQQNSFNQEEIRRQIKNFFLQPKVKRLCEKYKINPDKYYKYKSISDFFAAFKRKIIDEYSKEIAKKLFSKNYESRLQEIKEFLKSRESLFVIDQNNFDIPSIQFLETEYCESTMEQVDTIEEQLLEELLSKFDNNSLQFFRNKLLSIMQETTIKLNTSRFCKKVSYRLKQRNENSKIKSALFYLELLLLSINTYSSPNLPTILQFPIINEQVLKEIDKSSQKDKHDYVILLMQINENIHNPSKFTMKKFNCMKDQKVKGYSVVALESRNSNFLNRFVVDVTENGIIFVKSTVLHDSSSSVTSQYQNHNIIDAKTIDYSLKKQIEIIEYYVRIVYSAINSFTETEKTNILNSILTSLLNLEILIINSKETTEAERRKLLTKIKQIYENIRITFKTEEIIDAVKDAKILTHKRSA